MIRSQVPTVLIADDDRLYGESLCEAFGEWGWSVQSVTSADAAFAMLRSAPRDLVLSDVDMPEHSGFELLAWTRVLCPATSVVLMSARATPDLCQTAVASGAITMLSKPVDLCRLANLVTHLP
jgi:two-component system response regulator AtoC